MKKRKIDFSTVLNVVTKKMFVILLAAVMLTAVFSASVFAWSAVCNIENKNSISTGGTFIDAELSKDGNVLFSVNDVKTVDQTVNIDGKAGDTFTLKITNSGEINLKYSLSASVSGKELLPLDEIYGTEDEIACNVGEVQTYELTLTEDCSELLIRLNTSFLAAQVEKLEQLPMAEDADQQDKTEEESSEAEEKQENAAETSASNETAESVEKESTEDAVADVTQPTDAAEPPAVPTENTADDETEAVTEPAEPETEASESTTEAPVTEAAEEMTEAAAETEAVQESTAAVQEQTEPSEEAVTVSADNIQLEEESAVTELSSAATE